MSEMALTADHLVVIGRGRLIAEMPVDAFIAQSSELRAQSTLPAFALLNRASFAKRFGLRERR